MQIALVLVRVVLQHVLIAGALPGRHFSMGIMENMLGSFAALPCVVLLFLFLGHLVILTVSCDMAGIFDAYKTIGGSWPTTSAPAISSALATMASSSSSTRMIETSSLMVLQDAVLEVV